MFIRKNIFLVSVFVFYSFVCFAQTEFITTWQTTTPSESITIPTTGGGYNYNVNWGDASPDDTGVTGSVSHVYAVAGTYTVTITGTFNRIYFNGNATNAPKIQSIVQWGSTRAWTNMSDAFEGCTNLVNNATDVPTLTSATTLRRMFRNASAIGTGSATNWNSWNVSTITNMQQMFFGTSFNKDISLWNVSGVANFNGMFQGATSFNQDISGWITTSATNMGNMFRDCSSFNQDIGGWTTNLVANMTNMFRGATTFNQDISMWNTGMVSTMSFMFQNASSFNQNINGWNVSTVNNMDEMFRNATSFNQDLNSWVVTSVTNMNEMFRGATNFNGNISSWTPSAVINMANMFRDASSFNQDISMWNTAAVTSMSNMFYNATSFNQNIGGWTVTSVINMSNMFRGATAFNGDISGWVTSSVENMSAMFRSATAFNQDISGWNTSSATNMGNMFRGATAFDQNIGGWNVSNVTNFNAMFNSAKLSVANYNALLVGWSAQTLQPGESLNAGSSRYCSAAAIAARANIISTYSWSISDGGVLTEFVWSGDTDTNWNDNTNWEDGFDSDCTLDVTIPSSTNYPIVSVSDEFTVNNLTIDSGASLTIEGGLTVNGNLTTNNGLTVNSGGSIIVSGTSTGNLTYNRSLANANQYYYMSSPVGGETVEDIISNNTLSTGSGNVGFFYYDNNTTSGFSGTGFIFYQPSSTGSLVEARGYGIQLSAAGDVTFTGSMPTSDVSIGISEGTMGDINPNPDNLIGNPFPSYVAANLNANANNLLSNNTSILSEETMWFWDNTMSGYVPVNNGSSAFYVAPGQGFFVSSTSSGGTFNILESWQSHQSSETFYKSNTNPYRIKLILKNQIGKQKFTEVFFLEGATPMFDNGFDSSKLNIDTNFDVFSKLKQKGTDKNLAIQSLEKSNIYDALIPLEINTNTPVSIKIKTENIPKNVSIYLFDMEKNIWTMLEDAKEYNLSSLDKIKSSGRFYLQTSTKSLHTNNSILSNINIYTTSKNLVIKGVNDDTYSIKVYDILGKEKYTKILYRSNEIVSLENLKQGFYIIQLKTKNSIVNKKILLK